MWLFEYLFGIFTGYLILSPRLRNNVVKKPLKLIMGIKKQQPLLEPTSQVEYLVKPIDTEVSLKDKRVIYVEPDKVEEWLKNNPELKALNSDKRSQ